MTLITAKRTLGLLAATFTFGLAPVSAEPVRATFNADGSVQAPHRLALLGLCWHTADAQRTERRRSPVP